MAGHPNRLLGARHTGLLADYDMCTVALQGLETIQALDSTFCEIAHKRHYFQILCSEIADPSCLMPLQQGSTCQKVPSGHAGPAPF
jgi:hypothetical protein